jgi:hypothetical protein
VILQKRRLGIFGLAVVIGILVVWMIFWVYRDSQPPSPESIVGSWKSANTKTDVEITCWRSGDFQLSKTFQDNVLVKGSGSWEIVSQKLILSIDRTEPAGYEGNAAWEIVSITNDNLIYKGKEQYTLVRVNKVDEDFDSPTPPSFKGSSDKLERTVIVPTLETKLPAGKSAIWCATLSLAWKQLEKDVAKEPLAVEGAEELANDLSKTPDADLLPEHYYVAAGFHEDGIMDRIRRELPAKFPKAPLPPSRLAPRPAAALAYAYLETSIRFTYAFKDIDKPLAFKDSKGRPSSVKAFGIREEDKDQGETTYRSQVKVLFRDGDEFAIDLSHATRPYQIVLARIEKKATLKETLEYTNVRIAEAPAKKQNPSFGKGAILGVPNMDWAVEHHFKELEGKNLHNRALPAGSFIQEATQFMKFKIDRRGAAFSSGAWLGADWNGSHPEDFRFDRPYLMVLKKRDAAHPFFVMWVDNAELMQVTK